MINAFGSNRATVTRHEETIGRTIQEAVRAEGHRKGIPSKRNANQWNDDLSEIERKTLQGRHKGWSVPRIAAWVGISQKRVTQIIEERREHMASIGRPWA